MSWPTNDSAGATAFVEWSVSVIALVPGFDSRGAVPDDEHVLGVDRDFDELIRIIRSPLVCQQFRGFLDGQPDQLIDFPAGTEIATQRGRSDVDDLETVGNRIADFG